MSESERLVPLPPGTEFEASDEFERVRNQLQANEHDDEVVLQPNGSRREKPFRPTTRSPAAALIVCDDGKNTGEIIRLRTDRFIIGRTEGDLQISHDDQISARHLAMTRQFVSGVARWVVTDLQSRNGLFVRVAKASLSHMSELLVGSGRYRFEIVQQSVAETAAYVDIDSPFNASTRGFDNATEVGTEVLTELVGGGIGARLVLAADRYCIGSSPDCEIQRPGDPFVRDKHCLLTRSPKGTWMVKNNKTLNGIWLRMPQVVLEKGKKCDFQIGEQRLRLRFGVPL